MPATYEPIATTTLGSSANSITLNSIGSTYTDLKLILTAKDTSSPSGVYVRFNSDTGSNYSNTRIEGDGSSAGSNRNTNATWIFIGLDNTQTSLHELDILSYAGSTNKTMLFRTSDDRNGSGLVIWGVGLWRSTSAITSITIITDSGKNFASGTTATLYGIKAA